MQIKCIGTIENTKETLTVNVQVQMTEIFEQDINRTEWAKNLDKENYHNLWLVQASGLIRVGSFAKPELYYISSNGLVLANEQLKEYEEQLIFDYLNNSKNYLSVDGGGLEV